MSNSRHHIIGRSVGGTNHAHNIKNWKDVPHNAFHIVFENLPFKQQVARLVDINGRAINQQVGQDLIHFLDNHDLDEIYNRKCVRLNRLEKWEERNKRKIAHLIGR